MTLSYQVSYSTSSTGPWTGAGTVTTTTDTISGLTSGTNYFVQIITLDNTTGLTSAAVVSGPYLTTSGEARAGTTISTATGVQSANIITSNVPGVPGVQNTVFITSANTLNVNGIVIGGSAVVGLYYINNTLYQLNTAPNYYGPVVATTAAFVNEIQLGGSPVPVTTGVSISNLNVTSGSPINTVVGALSAQGSAWGIAGAAGAYTTVNNYAFSGTYVLGGTSASSFKIVGSNLVTNGALANGTYSITINASAFTFQGVAVSAPTATSFSVTVGQTFLQVPMAASLGTYFGGSQGIEGSILGHWNDYVNQVGGGRALYGVNAVGVNTYQAFPEGTGWAVGDQFNWIQANMPAGALSATHPIATYAFTDGSSTDTDYTAFINNQWPGQAVGSVATSITSNLATWKSLGVNKLYIRVNWEFNTIGGPDPSNSGEFSVPPSQAANFVAAWKFFANTAHTWGNNNGVSIRMVWCPDTSFTAAAASTGNVINYFPVPDGNAVNGRYIDVIGPDWYMGGYNGTGGLSMVGPNVGTTLNTGFTTPLASNTVWAFGTFAKMCQTYNCNFGICETGDSTSFGDGGNSYQDGTMAGFANYLNTFKTLSPAIPIEFISVFDVFPSNLQVTGGINPNVTAGWRCMFGLNPTQPSPNFVIPSITTISPI